MTDACEESRLAEIRERERVPLLRRREAFDQALRTRGKGCEDHDCLCAFARACGSRRLIDFEGGGWKDTVMRGLRLVAVHRRSGRASALKRVGQPCCAAYFEDWTR